MGFPRELNEADRMGNGEAVRRIERRAGNPA